LTYRDIPDILTVMLRDIAPDQLAQDVTQLVYEHAVAISAALGTRVGKPSSPRIADEVRAVVEYAQDRHGKLRDEDVVNAINSVIRVLVATCYPPATLAARAIFERKAGDAETDVEVALLAARARWDIEIGMNVPIRWLAALGGVSVKTARNLASSGQLLTLTRNGSQVVTAVEAARWLSARGIVVKPGSRGRSRRS
jgi:hypothetical protein